MSYKEMIQEENAQCRERLELVIGRVEQIYTEMAASVDEQYQEFFLTAAAQLLLQNEIVTSVSERGRLAMAQAQGKEFHERAFADLAKDEYDQSCSEPVYLRQQAGEEYGRLLGEVLHEIRGSIVHAYEGDQRYLCMYAELFVEIYNCFESEEGTSEKEIREILYSFEHDYLEIFLEEGLHRIIDPECDYDRAIVMDCDLTDNTYLYAYGRMVGADEFGIREFLQELSQEQIQAMADTYTEGYRVGFQTTGKDIGKKSVVEVRYPIGFERMVRAAIMNFEKIGLQSVCRPYSISENKQYVYDYKEGRSLWLDKAYVERGLEIMRTLWLNKYKEKAPQYGGPAVIEVFGNEPFSPEQKEERAVYSQKQQQLQVYEMSERSRIINEAIHGDERSFTIIAYPVPSIGEKFREIFSETVAINTLDYALYQGIQQKIIDVLDQADYVHILGTNGNRTDLCVNIWKLQDPAKETAFENCVADVNIPVGEVFTSPVLAGTNGRLHVSQVYLNELNYLDFEMDFQDGMVADYHCSNFDSEEKNRKYIEDNVLFHHKTLPMGEFAIGTNTVAYRMARKYDIADKLPILIAEKTGPHFAVGDTCYSHEEDNMTYNPDGKAIVARDNSVAALRESEPEKAYFNCHTDITIPYDELGRITVVRKDGTTVDIIADGRFVLPGTEELNKALDN